MAAAAATRAMQRSITGRALPTRAPETRRRPVSCGGRRSLRPSAAPRGQPARRATSKWTEIAGVLPGSRLPGVGPTGEGAGVVPRPGAVGTESVAAAGGGEGNKQRECGQRWVVAHADGQRALSGGPWRPGAERPDSRPSRTATGGADKLGPAGYEDRIGQHSIARLCLATAPKNSTIRTRNWLH